MTSPRNTSTDPHATAALAVAYALGGENPTKAITDMEEQGQRELVASTVLPTDMGDRAKFESAGFVFGDLVEGDPLFTHATLPAGWRREGSDHAMWSHIVDPMGRRRVAVFYKAAFYDRRAHMSLQTVYGYAMECANLWGDGGPTLPVLDREWATKDAVTAALTAYIDRETADADKFEASLPGRTPENRADRERLISEQRDRVTRAAEFRAAVLTMPEPTHP